MRSAEDWPSGHHSRALEAFELLSLELKLRSLNDNLPCGHPRRLVDEEVYAILSSPYHVVLA